MPDANGLLGVWMGAPEALEDDLNRWYETEHLSERLSVPGFLTARRYVSEDGDPRYMAFYRLTDVAVLAGEAYQAVAQNPTPLTTRVTGALDFFLRNEYVLARSEGDFDAPPAPYAYFVRLDCDEQHRDEMVRWYTEEHLARIAGVPGVRSSSLYVATAGSPHFLAIQEAESADVPRGPVWNAAIASPWMDKMRAVFKDRAANLGRLIASREAARD